MKQRKPFQHLPSDENPLPNAYMVIMPPEGYTFEACSICKDPYVYDGTSTNCLMCEMKKMETGWID